MPLIMRKRLLHWRIALGVLLGLYLGWQAGSLVPARAAKLPALEGTWKIDVTPDEQSQSAGEKGFKDTVTVKVDDTFSSEKFKKLGFPDAKGEIDERPYGPAQFKAILTSDKQGEVKFSGVATGQNIKGEIAWTKKDGTTAGYRFEGEKK
jgi:hypothetical protein